MPLSENNKNTVEAAQRNYPMNCWWVAAFSSDVGEKPTARWLLEQPVVLYRTQDGSVVALEDRCIHRWAPISSGYVEGDLLVCGYHGAAFDRNGRCTRFPTQSMIPDAAVVKSYRVIESNPFIWVWMGDAASADRAEPPPQFPWFGDGAWLTASGSLPTKANYFLMQENVLDLTHLNYAHRNTFKVDDLTPPKFLREGDKVSFIRDDRPFTVPAFQRDGMDVGDHILRRQVVATLETPAYHVADINMSDEDASEGQRKKFRSIFVHCFTPESPGVSNYNWIYGQDYGLGPGAAEALTTSLNAAFYEDKVVVEGIQNIIERDPRGVNSTEITFNGDMGGILARNALKSIMDKELRSAG